MTRRPPHQPLIEHAEGRDQDDRATLRACWRRIQATRRPGSTDLHVRELLFHVFARDRSGLGVQLTHAELAAELETTPRTARDVVDRAATEFRLLTVTQQRYITGGQSANRYAINWAEVQRLNTGGTTTATQSTTGVTPAPTLADATPAPPDVTRHPPDLLCHPPDLLCHPPDLLCHPPDVTRHPIEETPRSLPSILPKLSPPPPATDTPAAGWPVVASVLRSMGMSTCGTSKAIESAQGRDLTPADALDLVARFRDLRNRKPAATLGWLHRWLTGESPPPSAEEITPTAAPRPNRTLSSAEQLKLDRERIRARIVRRDRAAGIPEAVIDRRIAEALANFDRLQPIATP
jgi:hypothetical protein